MLRDSELSSCCRVHALAERSSEALHVAETAHGTKSFARFVQGTAHMAWNHSVRDVLDFSNTVPAQGYRWWPQSWQA